MPEGVDANLKPVEETIPLTAKIPELVISPKAPTEKLKINGLWNKVESQWDLFWKLRAQPQPTPSRQEEVGVISEGSLLHNLDYDPTIIQTIFESGVMSGEVGYKGKQMSEEDSETHFCADFFRSPNPDLSVKEYLQSVHVKEQIGGVSLGKMESFKAPSSTELTATKLNGTPIKFRDNDTISIVINPNRPELSRLIKNSSNGMQFETHPDRDPLQGIINEFPQASNKHIAVLVGIPANFIDKVVVGGGVEKNPQKLGQLKKAIRDNGLDIPIVSATGTILFDKLIDELTTTEEREKTQDEAVAKTLDNVSTRLENLFMTPEQMLDEINASQPIAEMLTEIPDKQYSLTIRFPHDCFISGRIVFDEEKGSFMYIDMYQVNNQLHRNGIGTRLLRLLAAELSDYGVTRLYGHNTSKSGINTEAAVFGEDNLTYYDFYRAKKLDITLDQIMAQPAENGNVDYGVGVDLSKIDMSEWDRPITPEKTGINNEVPK